MRWPTGAPLLFLALTLVAPPPVLGAARNPGVLPLAVLVPHPTAARSLHASAPPQHFPLPSPVGLKISAGYLEQYRPSAWVPVRITLHNRTAAQLAGTVIIPDSGGGTQYSSPSFSSTYSAAVLLPPAGTKHLTLYMPGQDVGDGVNVQFRVGAQTVARASDSPTSTSDGSITIGTLAGDPQVAGWIRRARTSGGNLDVIGLTPSLLDPASDVLATFDAIVLTNVDSARLTHDQLSALEGYVRAGGSLVLVGGPDWQETLRPLPAGLLPGTLAGSHTLPNLSGLASLADAHLPSRPTIVSRLVRPHGSVLAEQSGIPLIVRDPIGFGRILYLAFDPAVAPLASWRRAGPIITSLVRQSTPQVINRLSVNGFQSGIFRGRFGAGIIRQELANVPGAMQPTLALLIILLLMSILILGPVNFLVFRRLRRPEIAWLAIPLLAAILLATTVRATLHFKGTLVLLNTVGVIQLNGSSGLQPAAFYVGLFSSVRGTYHLVWNDRALPQALPQYSFDSSSSSSSSPVGLNLSEGAQTVVDFPSMNMWSSRGVALRTTVRIPGAVRSNLSVAPDGTLSGTIRNDTNQNLLAPAVLAGSAVLRLPDFKAHSTQTVRIRPTVDNLDHPRTMVWDRIYRTSQPSGDLGAWDGDPWEEPNPGPERSLADRLRNVGDRLPGGQNLPIGSGVVLLGWSETPLGSLTVDGAIPRRRDLNLIETALPVHFRPGTFTLLPGTLSAYLIDGTPQPPQNGCCPASYGSQVVGVGPGGSAVFQFDIPDAARIRFQRLVISVNAGGADGSKVAQVYDWHSRRWVHVNLGPIDAVLSSPARFISRAGALQIRLSATQSSGDIVIADPLQDVQLSGTATVG